MVENSLTVVLSALFVVCIFAQSFAGWRLQNVTLAAHGQALIGYWRNLFTGTFLEGLASNWQTAFLQLASLTVFSGFLYQRGAPQCRFALWRLTKMKRDRDTFILNRYAVPDCQYINKDRAGSTALPLRVRGEPLAESPAAGHPFHPTQRSSCSIGRPLISRT